MSEFVHDLPSGVYEWIEQIGGGTISRLVRHVARREAWIVDVARADGTQLEGFLRLQREDGGVDPRRLERETRIIEALGRTDVPVPAVHGWHPELRATLFARDPGRSDVDKLTDLRQQRAIMEDFMRVVARMHRLDLDALGIDDVMTPRPKNARETALNEVDFIVGQWQKFLAGYVDPLTTYGLDWLRRFAPEKVARVSLVQGDTGPVNFMFQGDRVSSVIDWELGHWGDPMEDLGNIVVREFWNPSGGLTGLFDLYAAESGIPYTRFAAQYYAVHQNVRGMIPIHAVCAHAHPRESLAWYLCYRYVGDRSTCEMIAQAMEIPISKPPMPEGEGRVTSSPRLPSTRRRTTSVLRSATRSRDRVRRTWRRWSPAWTGAGATAPRSSGSSRMRSSSCSAGGRRVPRKEPGRSTLRFASASSRTRSSCRI